MKKILYVITKSNYGGAQRYVFDLATSIPKAEFDVAVALGGTGEKNANLGSLDSLLKERGIRTIFVRSFMRDISIMKEFGALFELIGVLRKEKPDVVHLNSSKAGALGSLASRIAGVPRIIFTIHGLPYDEKRSFLWRTVAMLGTRLTCFLSHIVITVTKDNQDRVPKSLLIYNGIAPIKFGSGEKIRSAFPQGSLVIGTIGELNNNKNQDLLIELAHTDNQLHFALVGEGEKRLELVTKIKKYNLESHVKLFGFVSAGEALRGFDIFILPSTKEGLPYVLLEAGLAGLPVIASNVGGIPEIIENEKSGILINPKNSSEIITAVSRLIKNPENRSGYGRELNRTVSTKFSFEQMVSKTLDVYRN